jgi:hypothetical protein
MPRLCGAGPVGTHLAELGAGVVGPGGGDPVDGSAEGHRVASGFAEPLVAGGGAGSGPVDLRGVTFRPDRQRQLHPDRSTAVLAPTGAGWAGWSVRVCPRSGSTTTFPDDVGADCCTPGCCGAPGSGEQGNAMTRPTTSPASGALTPAHRASLPRGRILRSASDALSQPPWHSLRTESSDARRSRWCWGKVDRPGGGRWELRGPARLKFLVSVVGGLSVSDEVHRGSAKVTPNVALQQIFADRLTGSTSKRASRPTTRWCVGPRASYAPIGPGRMPRMAKQRMREFGALAALTLRR